MVPLSDPTDDTRCLASAALRGLQEIYRPGIKYKKAGVQLMDLGPKTIIQGSLFQPARNREASGRIMAAVDQLNDRYGRDTVQLAAAGLVRRWAMRSENRTPAYTTRWDELPTASAK